MIIMGLDPGLRKVGWGVIQYKDNKITHKGNGFIKTDSEAPLAYRLKFISNFLEKIILEYKPEQVAMEEIFVNKNPLSSIKLAQARGAILLTIANNNLLVGEYLPNLVKKTVVGNGRADKMQIQSMVGLIIGKSVELKSEDSADALAVAICHANHQVYYNKMHKNKYEKHMNKKHQIGVSGS